MQVFIYANKVGINFAKIILLAFQICLYDLTIKPQAIQAHPFEHALWTPGLTGSTRLSFCGPNK